MNQSRSEIDRQQIEWRQSQVLTLAADGYSEREIAAQLRISQPTIHRDVALLKHQAKQQIYGHNTRWLTKFLRVPWYPTKRSPSFLRNIFLHLLNRKLIFKRHFICFQMLAPYFTFENIISHAKVIVYLMLIAEYAENTDMITGGLT